MPNSTIRPFPVPVNRKKERMTLFLLWERFYGSFSHPQLLKGSKKSPPVAVSHHQQSESLSVAPWQLQWKNCERNQLILRASRLSKKSFVGFHMARDEDLSRLRRQTMLAPLAKRHRRTGRGGEGGCSPPKFCATQNFWAARENLGKASFQRRFHVFFISLKRQIFSILNWKNPEVSVIIQLLSLETLTVVS